MPAGDKTRHFLLLYGSQTGQAEAISEEIADNAESHGFTCDRFSLDFTEKKFNIERETCVVFVTSTTGDGDPPDTAQKFFRRLRKKTLPDTYLAHLNYALLGLGDSNYTNFCNAGKTLDKRLEELGAKRFYTSGWADDAVGLEVTVEPWMENLWPALHKHFNTLSNSENECPKCGCDTSVPQETEEQLKGDKCCNGTINKRTEVNGVLTSTNILSNNTSGEMIVQENGDTPHVLEPDRTNVCSIADSTHFQCISNDKELNVSATKSSECDSNSVTEMSDLSRTFKQEVNLSSDLKSKTTSIDNSINKDHITQRSGDQNVPIVESTLTKSVLPLSEAVLTVPALPPSYLTVEFEPNQTLDLDKIPLQNGASLPSAATPVTTATITSAKILTTEDALKKTISLRMKTENSLTYLPGDAISICCTNDKQEVDRLLQRLGLADKADDVCKISVLKETKKKNASVPPHLPPSCTVRHLFLKCVDIRETPKKAALRALVEHTADQSEKRRLQELCSKQGATDYTKHLRDASLSILDILETFHSCLPPVSRLLEVLPRLQPRPYSICSSPLSSPQELEVVFNVVEIPSGEGRTYNRQGVCTGMIDRLTRDIQFTGELSESEMMDKLTIDTSPLQIQIFGRTNQRFHVPDDITVPIIMIGPGTGVAPFVGFLRHRECQISDGHLPVNYGDTWLFFGCRHQDKDYLYRQALEDFQEKGIITRLLVCFSRDEQPEDTPRYVQHNILQNSKDLVDLIEKKKAVVYVCGDAKHMAKDVNETFMSILQKEKGINEMDAKAYVMQMRLHRQYLEDIWT